MSYEMIVDDIWWAALANGIKNVEGKTNSRRWGHLRTGDILVLVAKNSREKFSTRIVGILYDGGVDPLLTLKLESQETNFFLKLKVQGRETNFFKLI